ncbi:MAG TPA: phytanoyl-CoA dioxygenase family protein [Thermoanaerobaculia bacterium]|nr:phytanoyl-CoA dioxygenase family protein [Thermoanaerobaculia bacterium]
MIDLEINGFAVAEIALTANQCDHIAASLPTVAAGHGGIRNLLTHPTVSQFLHHPAFGQYIWSLVGRDLVAVNATLFERTAQSSRRAEWHQDRFVSVKERLSVRGYGEWTAKAGIVRVEAPAEVLAQMLAVRIHIDDRVDDGSLRAIAGSHLEGKLDAAQIAKMVATSEAENLSAARGQIVLMRPLLVHSSPAVLPAQRRRVIHIELAPSEAISPLQWQIAMPLRRAA